MPRARRRSPIGATTFPITVANSRFAAVSSAYTHQSIFTYLPR